MLHHTCQRQISLLDFRSIADGKSRLAFTRHVLPFTYGSETQTPRLSTSGEMPEKRAEGVFSFEYYVIV